MITRIRSQDIILQRKIFWNNIFTLILLLLYILNVLYVSRDKGENIYVNNINWWKLSMRKWIIRYNVMSDFSWPFYFLSSSFNGPSFSISKSTMAEWRWAEIKKHLHAMKHTHIETHIRGIFVHTYNMVI